MCRSSNELGGPRRCPAHARARFADALADLVALELREIQLYREASQHAADLAAPTARASRWFTQAAREVDDMRQEIAERDIDLDYYRDAYRDMLAARKERERTRTAERQALDTLGLRREEATRTLEAIGVSHEQAGHHLDAIDQDTGLAPPF